MAGIQSGEGRTMYRLSRLDTIHQRDRHTDSHVAIANATPTHCVGRQKSGLRSAQYTNFAELLAVRRFDEVVKQLKSGVDALHSASFVAIGDGAPCTTVRVTVMVA